MLKTLKGRTALAAAVLAAIGIALITGLQSELSKETVIASSVAQHEQFTARVAIDLDRQFRVARAALSEVAGNISGQQLGDAGALHYFLTTRIGIHHSFESIAVYGVDGTPIASRPSMELPNAAREKWFREALQNNGTPVVREPFFSPLSGEAAVALGYPVHDEGGALRGIIVGTLPLNQDQLAPSLAGGGEHSAHFVLVADDDLIAMHPDIARIARPVAELGPAAPTILAGIGQPDTSLAGVNYLGKRSLFSFRKVPSTGWTLVGVVTNEETFASLSDLSRKLLLAGGVLVALLVPAMWLLVSRMLRPLDQLRGHMRQLRHGTAVEPATPDTQAVVELRQFAQEFADMAAAWRTADAALQQEKQRAEITLQSIADGVIATNREGIITSINRAAESITGWRREDALGQPFTDVFTLQDERTGKPLSDIAGAAMHNQRVATAERALLHTKWGAHIPVDNSAAPIHTPAGDIDGAVAVFRNVSAERAAARQLEWRATHDALTGLANRAACEQALEHLFANSRNEGPHALLLLDLDEFKIVNDSCGHAAGDELLKQLSELFVERARKTDLVARLGGDEFCVLMQHCSGEEAMRLTEQLRNDIATLRFHWHGRVFRVGASFGVVEINDSFEHASDVQRAADMACYTAKRTGRDRICLHSPENTTLAAVRTEMSAVPGIRSAIDENRLRLYAQRIAPTSTLSAERYHFEILLRMVDEGGNIVLPGAFLPAAERYGLMDQIDRWVIAKSAQLCAQRFGPDCWHELDTVSINLSATTLRDRGIGAYIVEQFSRYGMPLRKVCLEVTETTAIDNLKEVGDLMRTLRARGLRFALDDFGAGVTSLAQLRDLPIDILKIDGSFIQNVERHAINAPLVEAIQMIAHRLQLITIAEKVGTVEELAHLEGLGIDYVQGYLVARPMPMDQVLGLPVVASGPIAILHE